MRPVFLWTVRTAFGALAGRFGSLACSTLSGLLAFAVFVMILDDTAAEIAIIVISVRAFFSIFILIAFWSIKAIACVSTFFALFITFI
jgi:hypothetical protein